MRGRREDGYTLIEMLLVVGLLALIAALAAPGIARNDSTRLDATAASVATALRFAHAEAVRTGKKHGVIANLSTQVMDLYRLDQSVNPPVVVYDVYHPVTKQPYTLKFGMNGEPTLSTVEFKFVGYPTTLAFVGFSATTGVPSYADTGADRMLDYGNIRLSQNGATRTISVSPMTARVTVQ